MNNDRKMCSFNDEDAFVIGGTSMGGGNGIANSNVCGSNKLGMTISVNQVNAAASSSPQSSD